MCVAGYLPSEHLLVWATCTSEHLPFWANFNCAIKIRNYHIIRCVHGAIRTYSTASIRNSRWPSGLTYTTCCILVAFVILLKQTNDLKWTFQILKTVDERVTAFANYMVDTYVDDGALYPPQLWAWEPDADEHDVSTTTNAGDTFHTHMKDRFNSPRPNLYFFAFKLL